MGYIVAIGVVTVLATSTFVVSLSTVSGASGAVPAVSAGTSVGHRLAPLSPPNTTIPVIGTPVVNWSGNVTGTLNATNGRPWGETYDPVDGCMYVTESPSTPSTQGYITWLGPVTGYLPTSQQIPTAGGPAFNPQGIAWALRYLGEPAAWINSFRAGILMIADTGSNTVSFYGITGMSTAGTVSCQPQFLQTDVGINWLSGANLLGPWDVVFDARSHLFYVTWSNSNAVQAWGVSLPGCEFFRYLSVPVGLSTDAAGRLEIANFQANGWVTQYVVSPLNIFPGVCAGNANAIFSSSPGQLDRSVWTVYAPLLLGNNTSTRGAKAVVAVSDANWNVAGNLVGAGCVLGSPATHVMGELKDGSLACLNSVKLDGAAPLNPGAYGIAYNPLTRHVLEVLSATGQVEAVNYNAHLAPATAAVGCPTSGPSPLCSVEVIWFGAPAGSWYPGNTMAVTNWGVGTLYIAVGA